jgi:hypothetical protein
MYQMDTEMENFHSEKDTVGHEQTRHRLETIIAKHT